ncbi:hypothetical protein ACLBOM_32760 [Escherichia coli]
MHLTGNQYPIPPGQTVSFSNADFSSPETLAATESATAGRKLALHPASVAPDAANVLPLARLKVKCFMALAEQRTVGIDNQLPDQNCRCSPASAGSCGSGAFGFCIGAASKSWRSLTLLFLVAWLRIRPGAAGRLLMLAQDVTQELPGSRAAGSAKWFLRRRHAVFRDGTRCRLGLMTQR